MARRAPTPAPLPSVARRAFLALLLALPACRGSPDPASAPAPAASPKVLGVALWEPESIDPALAGEEAGLTIAAALFEGLVRRDTGDGPARPGVAASWERSPDGLDWTFHLRPDARWSDGSAVTAADFDFAWRRVLDPATGARLASLLFVLDGAEDVHAGRADPSRLGLRTPDPLTLQVRLAVPAADFPDRLAHPVFAPVPRAVLARHGDRWTRPGNLVGNGPFALSEWVPGSRASVVRNPAWRAAASVALDGVDFHFLSSERLAYDWYEADRLQWMKSSLSRDRIPGLRRDRPAEFHQDPVLCTGYVAMQNGRPPLDDPRVRRALDLAVDKERLVREVLLGGQSPARSLVPPAIEAPTGYRPPAGPAFDPAAARALLAEARRDRGPLAPLVYAFNTGEANRVVAEFLQAQWKENLGVDVALESTEWATLLARVRRGDYVMARASWCADVVDPLDFLQILRSGVPNNYPRWADPAFDALLADARATVDRDARNALLGRAESRLVQAAPLLPLYHFTRLYLLSPRVRGFQRNLLDVHPLEDLDLLPKADVASGTP